MEITNGASIQAERLRRLELAQRNIDKLTSNTEEWKLNVRYRNSLNVLANQTERIGEKDPVFITEDAGEYDIERKKAKETTEMLNMFYVKASRCTAENGSKYFLVYLSKI